MVEHLPKVKDLLDTVSVTEINSFRECRRAWYLSEVMQLESKLPSPRFWFGTLIHAALETYYIKGRDLPAALDRFLSDYETSIAEIRASWGMLWGGIEPEFSGYLDLGREMLSNYFLFDHAGPTWTAIATEQRVWVPVLTPTGRQSRFGNTQATRLTARMDLLADVGDGRDDVSVVDHKTAAQRPSTGRTLDTDDQLTGYAYVYWRLTGELPRDLVYNVLIKALPQPPKVVAITAKNPKGRLSQDKSQKTLYGLYLEAVTDRGEDPRDYAEILESLRSEGWNDYFSRTSTIRNLTQLKSYEEHLYFTVKAMGEVVADPRKAYPSFSPMRCPSCQFQSVCQAMEDGGDFERLIGANFQKAKERRW